MNPVTDDSSLTLQCPLRIAEGLVLTAVSDVAIFFRFLGIATLLASML